MKRLFSAAVAGAVAVAGLTLTAAPASADVADRCANGVNLKSGAWKRDNIPGGRDVDWYKFSLANKKRVRVVLGNLPRNYALELYSSCGNRIGASNRGSRYFEEINKTLGAGTYRVKVYSKSRQSSTAKYAVRFQAFRLGRLHIVGKPRVQLDNGYLHTYVEVLNTSRRNLEFVKATVTYFNRDNRQIATRTSYTHLDKLIPMQRQSIEVLRERPRGYHHARVRVVGQRTSERAEWLKPTRFNVERQPRYDRLRFTGKIKNPHNRRVDFPWAVITGYDRLGNVSAQEDVYTGRTRIGARDTISFRDFEYTPWGGTQWFVIVAQGS
jgi:hypothetical protein